MGFIIDRRGFIIDRRDGKLYFYSKLIKKVDISLSNDKLIVKTRPRFTFLQEICKKDEYRPDDAKFLVPAGVTPQRKFDVRNWKVHLIDVIGKRLGVFGKFVFTPDSDRNSKLNEYAKTARNGYYLFVSQKVISTPRYYKEKDKVRDVLKKLYYQNYIIEWERHTWDFIILADNVIDDVEYRILLKNEDEHKKIKEPLSVLKSYFTVEQLKNTFVLVKAPFELNDEKFYKISDDDQYKTFEISLYDFLRNDS